MQQDATTCLELIEETSQAIDDSALKLLFVSVQQSNIDLCIRHAMEMYACCPFVYPISQCIP